MIGKFLRENKLQLILVFLIIVSYFLIRVINLTIIPVFADEAIYIRWSQVMKSEPTLRFLPLSDGKQPLFMWVLMPVLKLFQDPLFAGRFVSVMSGFGTLIGLLACAYVLFKSKRHLLLTGFIYAIIPFAVFFDRMAMVDSLLSCFGVWILFLSLLLEKYRRIDLAMVTGMVLGGALLTKSPAMFFAVLIPLTAIFIKFKSKKDFSVQLLKLAGLWGIVYAMAFGIYSILRLGPGFQMIASRNKDYVFSFSEVLSHPLNPFVPHIGQVWEWFWLFSGVLLIFSFIAGIIIGLKKYPKETFLLSSWFFGPLIVEMAIAKVFTTRYIFFILPSFILISTLFINWIFERIAIIRTTRIIQYLMVSVIVLLLSLPLLSFDFKLLYAPQKALLPAGERRGYLEEWTSGYGITQVRDYLYKLPADQRVIVGTEGAFGTLPDGLQIYFDKSPNITIVGIGLSLDNIPKQLVDSASKNTPTYLVVNKSRMRAQNDPGLKLIMEIPKAVSQWNQDSLLFYQVK